MSLRSTTSQQRSRRNFLGYAGGLTALAGSPFLANLASITAHAQSAPGYKALVCVFLFGGNDQSNTVVPRSGAEYTNYRSGRPALALDAASLLPISPLGYSGPELGLHPSLGALQQLFGAGKCAVVANVGTLNQPLTKAQWNNGDPNLPVPYQLFSHSDQQGAWQTGLPDRASQTGWLGRMGDALTQAMQPGSPLSVCISTGGNNIMQVGEQVVQYQISTQGAVKVEQMPNLFGENAVGGQVLR